MIARNVIDAAVAEAVRLLSPPTTVDETDIRDAVCDALAVAVPLIRADERAFKPSKLYGAEEMYGMIWFLAASEFSDPRDVRAAIDEARKNYRDGLKIAREVNRDA